ncbi:MAG: hypothetical protein JXR97_15255 [Planctomycetes bacterium]|nr:hypothetical protein [Planctomycetota bacterium]
MNNNRITEYFKICSGLIALVLAVAGCSEDSAKTDGAKVERKSAERMYAERIMPKAEDMGIECSEIERAVVAYTMYKKYDRKAGEGEKIPSFSEKAKKLVGSKGPCKICSAVAYEIKSENGGKPVIATYMFQSYRALPLDAADNLPQGDGREWILGEDGIAIGKVMKKSEVLSTHVEKKEAAAAAESTQAASEDKEKADTQAKPEQPEEKAVVADAVVDSEDTEKVNESKDATVAQSDVDSKKKTDDSESVKEGEEQKENVANADAKDNKAEDVKEETKEQAPVVAVTEPKAETKEEAAKPVSVDGGTEKSDSDDQPMVFLAAQGLVVEVSAGKDVTEAELDTVLASIRKKIAVEAEAEKKIRDEIASRHGSGKKEVKLEQKANPGLDIYWNLLDMAMGNLYREKF